MTYIHPDIIQKIKEASTLEEVVRQNAELKKSGTSFVAPCPSCNGKKLTYTPSRSIVKCFICDLSAKDAVSFLTNFMEMEYLDAVKQLAADHGILLEESSSLHPTKSFRDRQLKSSGIDLKNDRYIKASIDETFQQTDGDDLLLIYKDINGRPLLFDSKTRKKKVEYFRIRYRNPSLHKDKKTGKPIRYQSPFGSTSQLWLPDDIIGRVAANTPIDVLVICEGEKKATKLCQVGIPAVGVSGIHNFNPGEMSLVFEEMIRVCNVQSVIFLLDSDWNELKFKQNQSVDSRPKTFATAVIRFREYFEAYANEDIHLDILFGFHKTNNAECKGIDDFIVKEIGGREQELGADLLRTIKDRQGNGQFFKFHRITSAHDYKIRSYWHLNSPQKFLDHHKGVLSKVKGKFKQGRIEKIWNPESRRFEIAQEVMPAEEYWRFEEISGRNVCKLNHTGVRDFLKSRGFYKVRIDGQPLRLVKVEDRVVSEVDETVIRDFAVEFTQNLDMPAVLEMLLASDRAFMSSKLKDMYNVDFNPLSATRDSQWMVFNNKCIRVTEDEIKQLPLASMSGHVWQDEVIEMNINYEKPLFEINEVEGKLLLKSDDNKRLVKSQLFRFMLNTSNFHWRQDYKMVDGKFKKNYHTKKVTPEQGATHMQHLTSKMIAIGYILHNYSDVRNTRAIVCMDGVEAEVGKNEGGTGKSIFCTQFENIMSTFLIDAQSRKLTEDSFLFDGVDERTRTIILDDCRVNTDFKWFYSKIAYGLTANPKGYKKFFAGLKKWIFSTNHALGGSDTSTRRRQYTLAFSDYYGEHRTPFDDFKCVLFKEWNTEQWELTMNLYFCCLQAWLRFGFKHGVPEVDLEKRRLRQAMGEEFLEWATDFFGTADAPVMNHVNIKVERTFCYDDFKTNHPSAAKYINRRYFKDRMFIYCQYAGFKYNNCGDKSMRIRSGQIEYFVVADEHCPEKPDVAFALPVEMKSPF